MPRYPAAAWRPIARYQPGGSSHRSNFTARRLIFHTAVSNATPSMYGWFAVAGRATPHFYVGRGGEVEQYIDTDHGSTANLNGNHDCITVETWDGGTGPWSPGPAWTDAQVEALARLAAWCYQTHGIPLVRLPSSLPGTRGIGWHRLGIDGNFPDDPLLRGRVPAGELWSSSAGKLCPTDTRIRQTVGEVIPRAVQLAKPKHLPLEVWFANMSFHRGHDRRHLAWMVRQGAKVLLLVECKDIDVANLLPEGWTCVQDRRDEGRAGSVVAWHEPTFRVRRRRGVRLLSRAIEPTVEDEGMWPRYVNAQTLTVRATGERYRFAAAHLAPERYRRLWPEQIMRLRALRRRPLLPPLVLGTDANQDVHELADELRMVAEGRGIVGILTVPKRVRVRSHEVSTWAKDKGWTDHVDVSSTIERK